MKAFPSNVSVTILNRRQYDKNLSNDLNKVFIFEILNSIFVLPLKAWDDSQDYLRTQLFRNQAQHRIIDSTDKYFMFYKSELLEYLIKDSINKWREQKGLA
jgi:hypothetical protein